MTTPSVHCHAKLGGIAKKHDRDGDWAQITLRVLPEDLPIELWQAPLGTIFVVAFARVGDDGVAVKQEAAKPKAKESFNTMSRCKQAGILCKDAVFRHWVAGQYNMGAGAADEATTARVVRHECGVDSRRELDGSGGPALKWDELLDRFEIAAGRTTEARG